MASDCRESIGSRLQEKPSSRRARKSLESATKEEYRCDTCVAEKEYESVEGHIAQDIVTAMRQARMLTTPRSWRTSRSAFRAS